MKYIENLSNAIVQFEDGVGFSSASAPPNDIYFAEERYNKEHDCYQCLECFTGYEDDYDASVCCTSCRDCGFRIHGSPRADECCPCTCEIDGGGPNGTCADIFGAEDEDEIIDGISEIDGYSPTFTPVEGYKCDGCGKTIKEGYNFQDINVMWHIDDGDFTGDYDMKDHLGGYNDWFCIPCAENAGYAAEEEGNTPISDPMEFGEPANWTPLDGTPSLKRRKGAETYAAENQVFALTYFIENDVNMADVTDVTEALELYLNLNGDILEMEAMGLQKHPHYETANRLLSDLSYRLDELQTQTPNIIPKFELDAEYDAWRSAFTDGAAATQINKYQRGWMQKVMNPRSRQIKSMWEDSESSFNEELKSAEMTALDRMGFRRSYGKPISALLAVGIGYLIYRKL